MELPLPSSVRHEWWKVFPPTPLLRCDAFSMMEAAVAALGFHIALLLLLLLRVHSVHRRITPHPSSSLSLPLSP